jgi:hypothetical protein
MGMTLLLGNCLDLMKNISDKSFEPVNTQTKERGLRA